MRTGVFVGSFDPFTIGHDSIVTRLWDCSTDSSSVWWATIRHKPDMAPATERMKAIQELYADEARIEVKPYYGLAVDFAKAEGAHYIVKGVRSVKDFEYEREQADINRQISGIETVLLFAEPQYASVSSSVIRELRHFGRDVNEFLPQKK